MAVTHALFVHGMGRTPVSGWWLGWRLGGVGVTMSSFAYSTIFENFERLRERLLRKVMELAERGEYVLVGHSLGGVLIRQILAKLPDGVRRPNRVFLLGSPVRPSRLAHRLKQNYLFRVLSGDCGRLLGSPERMASIPPTEGPTTNIIGIRGIVGIGKAFGTELNDGVVTLSEVSASWAEEEIQVAVVHTFLPSSRVVGEIIVSRLRGTLNF